MANDLHIPILDRLKKAQGDWVRADSFAPYLARLPEEIETIRKVGGIIEGDANLGYRLVRWPDLLLPDELSWRLGTKVIGRIIRVYQQTSSTNDIAWEFYESGEPEGGAVFAESQTAGRGRMGRSWLDAPGKSILVSVLLRPALPIEDYQIITVLGAVALCNVTESLTRTCPEIKWPNDVLLQGKKVAGVLVEARTGEDSLASAFVIGMGINVSQSSEEFPEEIRHRASSLEVESGRPIKRAEFARRLLCEMDRLYESVRRDELEELERSWQQRCNAFTGPICLEEKGIQFRGRAVEYDLRDGLVLQLPNGNFRTFRSEHVTVIPE